MDSAESRPTPDSGSSPLSLHRALLLGAAGGALIALSVSGQIYLSMLSHGHSFVRIAGWQLCSWVVWAAATPVVLRLGAQLSEGPVPRPRHLARVLATGLVIFSIHLLVASVCTVGFQPYAPVQTFQFDGALIMQMLSLPSDLLVYGLLLVIGSSLAASQRARSLELREARLEADLARSQLDALRLEIEPHFLFNTLNSIATLIRARAPERALSMLLGLSDLLRETVGDGRRHQNNTLRQEADFVKRYIELQRVRFSDRLSVRYAISSESEACAVPAFLLQPVVENAFRHGLAKRSGPVRLELAAAVKGGELHVWVRDDGAGLPPGFALSNQVGTGLRNTRQRLHRLYNDAAQLSLEAAEGGGAVVYIRLPAHDADRCPADTHP